VEQVVSAPMAMVFDMKLALYFRFAYETLGIVIGESMEAHTPRQFIFLYIMSFIGVCMIAGLFGQVGSIITSYSKERIAYLETMKDTVRTMRYLQLPDGLRSRVIRYHEYVYNVFGSFETNKLRIFTDKLSKPLQAEIKLHCHTNLIRKVPLFEKLDRHISRYLIDCLVVEIYMPGDFVIREGEFDSRLYMIMKGTCHVLIQSKKKPVRVLNAGDYFGEVSLVTRVARSATVRAQSFCNFAVITKEDYDKVKNDHQTAFAETEKVMMARLDSYKGINKNNRKIRRFSVQQSGDLEAAVATLSELQQNKSQSNENKNKKRKKPKLKRRRSKEPMHVGAHVVDDGEECNIKSNSKDSNGIDDENAMLVLPPLPPIDGEDENKIDVTTAPASQKYIEDNTTSNNSNNLLSLSSEMKIVNQIIKKGKKGKKKVAHHINDKLSAIKKTQRMLKESMEQNKAGIDLILKSLTQQGVIAD
jgi:CRP-like cAMP-binding protein